MLLNSLPIEFPRPPRSSVVSSRAYAAFFVPSWNVSLSVFYSSWLWTSHNSRGWNRTRLRRRRRRTSRNSRPCVRARACVSAGYKYISHNNNNDPCAVTRLIIDRIVSIDTPRPKTISCRVRSPSFSSLPRRVIPAIRVRRAQPAILQTRLIISLHGRRLSESSFLSRGCVSISRDCLGRIADADLSIKIALSDL